MVSETGVVAGLVLTLGGLVGLVVGYVAWQRRSHPAALPLAKMSVLPGMAGICFALAAFVPQPPVSRWMLAGANAFLSVSPGYFLLFTIAYTGQAEMLTDRRRNGIVAVYLVSAGVAGGWILFGTPVTTQTVGALTLPVVADRGGVLLSTLAFSYPAVLGGFWLLGRFLLSPRNVYRRQTAVITLGMALTVVGNLAFEAGLSPHPGLNLTAVFFAFQSSVVALALFRYEFLNVEPIAPEVVLNEIDDPVLVLDESDSVVDANPAARALYRGDSLTGTPVETAFPGLVDAIRGGREYRPATDGHRPSSGSAPVYDVNAAPVRDQYDRDRGRVVVLRDVTLLKRRERTLEGLQTLSQRFLVVDTQEAAFEIAIEAADELLDYPYSGAMRYDEGANVLRPVAFTDRLSAAYENAAVDSDPAVGPGDSDVWTVFRTGEPMLGDALNTGGERELPVDIGGSLLYPLGDHGVLGISAGPDHGGFGDDDRRFAEILARTTENALDRIEKEQQLRESRELLAERNEQIEFFNSILRHDLRNGMMTIQGQAVQLGEELDGDARGRVETIRTWSEDIAALAEKVRSVTDAVTAGDDTPLESVDVAAAVEERAEKVRGSHEEAEIRVSDGVPSLPAVRSDDLLAEVIENLLVNAVEHNDTDRPEVTVDGTVDEKTVTLRIADNGPGVGDGMKEQIFEERVTSSDSGSIGFGLYFVRTMVEQYGGSVRFEDNDPRGAVAVVTLPRAGAE
jgi:signal transduction histidine kinase